MGKTEKRFSQCVGCQLAHWNRKANGHLHPSGEGRCRWKMPKIDIPMSFYYTVGGGFIRHEPHGGYITRFIPDGRTEKPCPTMIPIDRDKKEIS